jgi:hypothetical protein
MVAKREVEMAKHAEGNFRDEANEWEEKTTAEFEGGLKITQTTSKQYLAGDMDAVGTVNYVTFYHADGTCTYVGITHLEATLDGKKGAFVVRSTGRWEVDTARESWAILPGTGTGELAGIKGEGGFAMKHGASGKWTLDYDFE